MRGMIHVVSSSRNATRVFKLAARRRLGQELFFLYSVPEKSRNRKENDPSQVDRKSYAERRASQTLRSKYFLPSRKNYFGRSRKSSWIIKNP